MVLRRDEFSIATKILLAKRVGFRCSNPNCQQPTSGPAKGAKKAMNIGVAAHITAALPAGSRYDETLSNEERRDPDNGIWCCQNCAKLVDNDAAHYSVDLLRRWKDWSEESARSAINSPVKNSQADCTGAQVDEEAQEVLTNAIANLLRPGTIRWKIPGAMRIHLTIRSFRTLRLMPPELVSSICSCLTTMANDLSNFGKRGHFEAYRPKPQDCLLICFIDDGDILVCNFVDMDYNPWTPRRYKKY
jgi:hypothetical protein